MEDNLQTRVKMQVVDREKTVGRSNCVLENCAVDRISFHCIQTPDREHFSDLSAHPYSHLLQLFENVPDADISCYYMVSVLLNDLFILVPSVSRWRFSCWCSWLTFQIWKMKLCFRLIWKSVIKLLCGYNLERSPSASPLVTSLQRGTVVTVERQGSQDGLLEGHWGTSHFS